MEVSLSIQNMNDRPADMRRNTGVVSSARLPAPPKAELRPALNESENRELERLQERDRYVRNHEASHAAALGPYGGAVRYSYKAGPDGRLYADGGYTEVNTMPAATPEATAAKARVIRNAALAPGAVSGTDFAVSTQASHMERSAMAAILRSRQA